jgi:hypothetical protein
MIVPGRLKTGPARFNIEFDNYMIVLSRFKIVAARSCLLFAQFKSQHNLAFPMTVACDADDEVFREGASIAVAICD